MLVSAIGKFDAVKIMNNSAYNRQNTFNGDKNLEVLERCKPHCNVKSVERSNRTSGNFVNKSNEPSFCLMG